ncbi:MAG TPA: GNAT family N-acetyltransferase [Beijerinckiaceae bacterium]|nr:GNAT family N-acetyltransferase [Beijerinckiaceae bacterium]HZY21912.1 GNAT family N-acetyltransferase [Beijerinckiaceae bacterium]
MDFIVHASHRASRTAVLPRSVARGVLLPRAGGGIAVEIVDADAFAGLALPWRALVAEAAEPNVFMEPALVLAAQLADRSTPIKVLLGWRSGPDGRQLAGAWAFAVRKGVLPRLQAPAAPLAALASPVIRSDCVEDVLESWFQALADSRALPKILELRAMPDEGPIRDALDRVVRRHRSNCLAIERRERAVLRSSLPGAAYLERSVSGSRRRKLRQLRSRLARKGAVAYHHHTGPEAVALATEAFLALEARGWKGRRGSAVGCDERLAAFTRAAMAGLSAEGLAAVTSLTLDGEPVSMGVVLRSGGTAYTWKIAYEEAAAAFSPGYLLALEDTAAFLADDTVAEVDSCASADFGIMAEVWSERKSVADFYIDVRSGASLRFRAMMLLVAAMESLPRLRRKLRGREQLRRLYSEKAPAAGVRRATASRLRFVMGQKPWP